MAHRTPVQCGFSVAMGGLKTNEELLTSHRSYLDDMIEIGETTPAEAEAAMKHYDGWLRRQWEAYYDDV